MVKSDEEDESLAQFLESEVLSFTPPDEGNGKDIVENGEAKWQAKIVKVEDKNDKKKRVVEDHGKQREETREAKRVKFEEKAEDVKAKALLSFPSPIKFKAESESASSHPKTCGTLMVKCNGASTSSMRGSPWMIETGILSKIPPELLHHILKFLSSEDLVACSLVCKFFNCAASDESLWRRLYCLRWGLALPTKKPRECAWKKLYFKRDAEDMGEFVNNCPTEFKEYYIQMQAAKRSQAPLPSEINDDRIILDKTVADQVSIWKKSKGLGDKVVTGHACSGETCAYHQIGDVFVCEKTGNVHVCDDTCREFVLDPINGQLVCTISGHCSERMVLLPDEMEPDMVRNYCWPMDSVSGIQSPDKIEPDIIRSYSWPMDSVSGIKSPDKMEQQQAGPTDEAEPFMGSGRLARAYLLGYNCDDEKELEIALRFY